MKKKQGRTENKRKIDRKNKRKNNHGNIERQ